MLPKSTWPKYDEKILKGINKIILSGKVNYLSGEWGQKFESAFSKYHNLKYSIAVSNGTIGLEIALSSLCLSEGDEVIVTPRSYYTSASCIIRNKLKPVFVDVDLNSQNICKKDLLTKISKNTKCIICVHLAGYPCDMKEIIKISKKNKIKIIEDCSQAHGAKIDSNKVGSFGDVSVWSFCNDKIMSTLGEGGMISTNNKKIYEIAWSLKDTGKNFKKFYKKNKNIGFQWLHDSIGTNARLTEIQSFSGLFQLKYLDTMLQQRKQNANYIINRLKKFTFLKFPILPKNYHHSYYRLNFLINNNSNIKKISRNIVLKDLKDKIFIREGSCPEIYNEKYFKNKYDFFCPNAHYIGKNSLSLQVDNSIKKENLVKTVNFLDKYFKNKI